jgi:recombinational DNA repair protein (RecF pathway)
MQSKIEGIVLSKAPFQERHLICRILLRSGKIVPVVFYGGSGGGKKNKGSTLEFGYMMKIELGNSKKNSELYNAKEWVPVWSHKNIRLNHRGFSLLCFYLECALKFGQETNLHEESEAYDDQSVGLFRAISSSVFYLDQVLESDNFHFNWNLITFISKLIAELGIYPDRTRCILSGEGLCGSEELALIPNHGGFALISQMNKDEAREYNGETGRLLWNVLGEACSKKYQELEIQPQIDLNASKFLFHYLGYQFQLQESDFKTINMIF